jgi:hypothetical protein
VIDQPLHNVDVNAVYHIVGGVQRRCNAGATHSSAAMRYADPAPAGSKAAHGGLGLL